MLPYRLLLAAALPVLIARLGIRVLRGAEPRAALCERLGLGAGAPGALWLHAASNGELVSARPLIEALFAAAPGLRILVTTNTATARAMAQDWGAGWAQGRITAQAAPLDGRGILRRFLRRNRPLALVGIENELWPNRFDLCAAGAIPVFVIGARMSVRSAGRWRATGLGPRLMHAVTALSAQDAGSEAAFLSLGLPPDRLLPVVNLKTVVSAPAPAETLGWPRAETILAASTHEGEEEIALDAFAHARAARPGLRLILAPRHPRRAPEIARMITARGLEFTTRSRGEAAQAPVLLADTMGEMANWYAAAGLCFVGGTLTDRGGHTPFEPVAYGCAIAHGPHVTNHAAPFAALDAAGAAIRVTGADDLAAAFALPPDVIAGFADRAGPALSALSATGAAAGLAARILAQLPVSTAIDGIS